jgi:hypothetical protein
MSPQQQVSAAQAYGERLSLCAVLGLTTTDEHPDAAREAPAVVTDDQATHLADMLAALGKDKRDKDQIRAGFLKYFEATSVSEVRAVDYARAVQMLARKQAQAARTATEQERAQ